MPDLQESQAHPYQLDSGDELRVIVLDDPQLSGQFKVDGTGAISIPTVQRLEARGKTTAQLEQDLRAALKQGQLRSPEVSVEVVTARPFFILGEVARPGAYPYVPDMSVLTAVAIAGGFTYRAQGDYVSVTRKIDNEKVERRAGRSARIEPGDVIYVFERII
ncbi:polysaccharide biosynthesis/export family protein [Azospirillum thermophilum]|uniref:Polysaccharide biosynthesis protein n=1 Tax=Azospirillum thermophilum TaxID=2202148 RepID=A0A2S2CVG7_9PROT|nr:polysaccharide biosynthesis protein [Azospirillum thermophilum]